MATVEVKKGVQKTRKEYVLRLNEAQLCAIAAALSVAYYSTVFDPDVAVTKPCEALDELYSTLRGASGIDCERIGYSRNGRFVPTARFFEVDAVGLSVEAVEVPDGEPEADQVTMTMSAEEARAVFYTLDNEAGGASVHMALAAAGLTSHEPVYT